MCVCHEMCAHLVRILRWWCLLLDALRGINPGAALARLSRSVRRRARTSAAGTCPGTAARAPPAPSRPPPRPAARARRARRASRAPC